MLLENSFRVKKVVRHFIISSRGVGDCVFCVTDLNEGSIFCVVNKKIILQIKEKQLFLTV